VGVVATLLTACGGQPQYRYNPGSVATTDSGVPQPAPTSPATVGTDPATTTDTVTPTDSLTPSTSDTPSDSAATATDTGSPTGSSDATATGAPNIVTDTDLQHLGWTTPAVLSNSDTSSRCSVAPPANVLDGHCLLRPVIEALTAKPGGSAEAEYAIAAMGKLAISPAYDTVWLKQWTNPAVKGVTVFTDGTSRSVLLVRVPLQGSTLVNYTAVSTTPAGFDYVVSSLASERYPNSGAGSIQPGAILTRDYPTGDHAHGIAAAAVG